MSMVLVVAMLLLLGCAHELNPHAKVVPVHDRAYDVGNHVDRLRDF
jgi:hypothetical protein